MRVLAIAALVLVVIFFGKGILRAAAITLTAPFYAVAHYLEHSSGVIPALFRDRTALLDTQRELEAQLAAQEGSELVLAQALAENTELRALVGALKEPRIAAGVVARPPYTPYDTLIIDQGSIAGIQEHAPVFMGGGLAVGYVRMAAEDHALVSLFSSPGVETSVYIFGPDIFARAHGAGGGVLRIDVPQGIPLAEGNLVVLPSLDSGVLGVIDAVESTPTGPEQHAFVTLASPMKKMRVVSVGTQPVTPVDFETAAARVDALAETLFAFPIPEIELPETGVASSSDADASATSTSL